MEDLLVRAAGGAATLTRFGIEIAFRTVEVPCFTGTFDAERDVVDVVPGSLQVRQFLLHHLVALQIPIARLRNFPLRTKLVTEQEIDRQLKRTVLFLVLARLEVHDMQSFIWEEFNPVHLAIQNDVVVLGEIKIRIHLFFRKLHALVHQKLRIADDVVYHLLSAHLEFLLLFRREESAFDAGDQEPLIFEVRSQVALHALLGRIIRKRFQHIVHGDTKRHMRRDDAHLPARCRILVHVMQIVRTRTLQEVSHRAVRNPYCSILIHGHDEPSIAVPAVDAASSNLSALT